jgi:hypothetical protein
MGAPQRKYSVGGLKLSEPLVQIRFSPQGENRLEVMIRRLADREVNLIGLALDVVEGRLSGVGWIRCEDQETALEALKPLEDSFEIRPGVGLLTLFPIQARSDVIRDVLYAWGEAGLPLFQVSSSPTSLTLATDYARLDEAVSVVLNVVSLPENHAPFRPEYRVKQL